MGFQIYNFGVWDASFSESSPKYLILTQPNYKNRSNYQDLIFRGNMVLCVAYHMDCPTRSFIQVYLKRLKNDSSRVFKY